AVTWLQRPRVASFARRTAKQGASLGQLEPARSSVAANMAPSSAAMNPQAAAALPDDVIATRASPAAIHPLARAPSHVGIERSRRRATAIGIVPPTANTGA